MDPVEITAGRWHLRPWSAADPGVDGVRPALRDGRDPWSDGTGAAWAVCDSTTGEVQGSVELARADSGATAWEARVATSPAATGRGLASESLATACRWAFAAAGATRVEARVPMGHWAARRVIEKAGFVVEGVRREGAAQEWVAARLPADAEGDTGALPAYPGVSDGEVALRRWRGTDAPDVARACDDLETARWLPVPVPYTPADAASYVDVLVPQQWADGSAANVAVTDARTGALLGAVGLKLELRAYGVAEIGYWTAPWARGRGVAGRAARLHANWGHGALGLGRVELLADVGNAASQRAAERGGFVREGLLRGARPQVRADGRADMLLFASVR